MKRLGATATAMAALVGAAAAEAQERARPTQAELFCHDLKRLVREAPDFEGMWNARPAPPWLGFRPGSCRYWKGSETSPPAYWCHQQLAPAHQSLKNLADMTAACLPGATRLATEWPREASFETAELRIHITESGGPGAKVGRIVGYRVEAKVP